MRKNLVTKNILKEWRNFEASISINESNSIGVKYKIVWDLNLGGLDINDEELLRSLGMTANEAINDPDELNKRYIEKMKQKLPEEYTDYENKTEEELKDDISYMYRPAFVEKLNKIERQKRFDFFKTSEF